MKENRMSNTARRVVASDGTAGSLTPAQIADYAVVQRVATASDRPAWLAFATAAPGQALTALCDRLRAARPTTPATPAVAASGASSAAYPASWTRRAGAAVAAALTPAPEEATAAEYPAGMARSVAAARRGPGLRVGAAKERAGAVRASGQPILDPTATATGAAAATRDPLGNAASPGGAYSKSVVASSFAAQQEAARQADARAMRAEQAARYGA